MRIPFGKLLRAFEVLAWAAFFAFAIVFLGLRYWLLPNVERYREDIVAAISNSIGLPVKIGALTTDWQGLRPRLSIADVRVYDRDGREALALPAVENVVSWRTLLAFDLRLHSFAIDGPKLAVRRDAKGNIFVAGIRITEDQGDGKLTDWILRQRAIVVRDAEIEWHDESRGAPPLVLSALNFRLENDGDDHAIGLSARPPRQLGPGLEVRARLAGGSVRQPHNWNGRVFAEFGYTDLAGWRAWVDYPLDVRRGEGALRLWTTLSAGRISQATADVALANVSARLGEDLPVLEMTAVRGRVHGRETARGYEFGVRNLALASAKAPAMNATSFRATWEPASSATLVQRGSVSANLIELGPLAHLAEFLPFPADLRRLLAELVPQGNLLDAKFDWSGELPDQATFTAKTRFAGLTMNAWRGIPGFANLSGNLDANEKKGVLYLASRKSELDLPEVFPEARIQFDTLTGEIGWERASGGVTVRLANLGFANEDLAGTAFGSYAWPGEGPGVADLSAQFSRADARHTGKYLPLSRIMGERTRAWIAGAVLGGQASEARLRLKGDLRDFPFADPAKGQFQVAVKVSEGVLDYTPGWPRINAIEGELMFEREKMEFVGRSGTILGARVANVRVSMPNLMEEHPRLTVDGSAEGPTAEFLEYIQKSPVRGMVGGLTDPMSATGRGRLRLRLDLPLHELARSKVAGEYLFAANNVTVDPRMPAVERAGGRVSFTDSGLTVHDVRGQLFGDQVRISGGTKADASLVIVAEGRATIDGLRPIFDHPWRRRLAGGARYSAAVAMKDGRTQLSFDSSLEGVASSLPPPFAKSAAEALPLRVEVLPGDARERISVFLGKVAAAEFLRTVQGSGAGATMQVQRSVVMLHPAPGEVMRMPERRGMTLRGSLPAFDLDRWLPLLTEGGGAGGASFELRVGILDALGKRMRDVTMQGVVDGGGWSANMATAEFAGDLVYRAEDNGRLVARFSRFTLPEDAAGVQPGEAVQKLPAVDIVAESFTHRNRKLGRIEIQARHEGRDWRIDKLAMLNPESSLSGTGLWKVGAGSRTSLAFKLEVSDVGKFLDRFGYPDHVKGANGALNGTLAWNGDPLTLDYATLSGDLQMKAGDGQFLEIEPGIGKLVSLMSLQMLPRRIALDFRDVFSKGFQFDNISSSLGITRGVMTVKDFRMRGPAADVSMTGQIDLSLETQNLMVRVVPQLGDTASTVVSLLNPIAGVATLIAGRLLKNPLGKIFAFEYAISGTWTEPKVEKVQAQVPVAPEGSELRSN